MEDSKKIKTNEIIIFKTEDEKISVGRGSTDRKIGNSDFSIKRTNQADIIVSSAMTQFEAFDIQDTKHICEESKMDGVATCRKFRQVQKEGDEFNLIFQNEISTNEK